MQLRGVAAVVIVNLICCHAARGGDLSQGNIINISAVLFMWCTLPGFGAAAYIPSIVLERPLFTRSAASLQGKSLSQLGSLPFAMTLCL